MSHDALQDRESRIKNAVNVLLVLACAGLTLVTIGATIHYGVAGFLGALGLSIFVIAMIGIAIIDR